MSVLRQLSDALASGSIEVIDLTSKLSSDTPCIQLPPEFGQTAPFALELISDCDEKGPGWYWNNIHTGEHTGTHFDAPNHWATGRDLEDISQVAPVKMLRPAVVLDFSAESEADPDFLLTVEHIKEWEKDHGPLPEGGWLIYRTGWAQFSHSQDAILNRDEAGAHTPGMTVETARWLAEEAPIIGVGVETVGTDAGQAFAMEPMYPMHAMLHGVGKYGLTQLQNVDKLPPTGAMILAAPLPIVGGSGSPVRVLALVER